MMRTRGHLRGWLLLPVIPAQTVLAATITVDSLSDTPATPTAANCNVGHAAGSCRLRDAIETANNTSGAVINFSVTGTISIKATLTIASTMTITGPGAASLTLDATSAGNGTLIVVIIPGAIPQPPGPTLSLSGLTLANDTTAGTTVISHAASGTLNITDCILDNLGGNGTEVLQISNGYSDPAGATLTLTRDIFRNNGSVAHPTGTVIDSQDARVTITDSFFTNNRVGSSVIINGSGNHATVGNVMTITNSTFSGNTGTFATSSIINNFNGAANTSRLALINSTLSGNTTNAASGVITNTTGNAGGLISGSTAHLVVVNSTVANTAGGFGIQNAPVDAVNDPGDVTLTNTVVAGNGAGDLSGASYSGTNNLIGSATSSGGFTDNTSGNIVGHPAQLGTLGDNGGTFVLPDGAHIKVVPLQSGSPAIGAGNGTTCITATNANPPGAGGTDERGATRTATACDIGAYQSVPVVTGIAPAAGSVVGGDSITLTGLGFGTTANTQVLLDGVAIPAANVTSVTPTTVTYKAPAHAAGTVTATVAVNSIAGLGSASYQYVVINTLPGAKPQGSPSGNPGASPASRPVGPPNGAPSPLPPPR